MKYVVCNLKNRLDKVKSIEYASRIDHINKNNIELIIAPSSVFLNVFYPVEYKLSSQDISSVTNEVVTGEITGSQLKSLNVDYVIVGHSERRMYKNENSNEFKRKIKNAQEENIKVIYCIGENKEQRNNFDTFKVLEEQLKDVLDNVDICNIIIAYEPIWAIGSGINPPAEEIKKTISYIKQYINKEYNKKISVIYGGSVNTNNIGELNNIEVLDGYILGSASLDIKNLEQIIEVIAK